MSKTKTAAKKKRILWVEDDWNLVELYKTMIGTMPGIELEVITLGTHALQKIKEIEAGAAEKPDLVMLDLLLPDGINGDKILEVMRQTPSTKDVPVYILTNYGGEEMESELTKNLNAEKYMIKTEWSPSKLMPFLKEKLGLK
ncbi:MAG: response regulator [Parcubacteria group bacterium]|nr:response regulator [Parcubacteria group bacterium]